MSYVDGFVLPVPADKIDAYQKMATDAGKMWMELGALAYFECALEDLEDKGFCQTFHKGANMKEGETPVFAFIIYKSRAHRDEVNAKIMSEEHMKDCKPDEMPFDMARMMYGGFKTLVEYQA